MHACTKSLSEACRKCGLVVFIYEHGYILTERGRTFMTFLKKNYEIALVSTEKVKHGLEYDIDST